MATFSLLDALSKTRSHLTSRFKGVSFSREITKEQKPRHSFIIQHLGGESVSNLVSPFSKKKLLIDGLTDV